MVKSVEQIVRDYEAASKSLRRKIKTRAQARAFLLKAGILEKDGKSGVRLAKRFR